MPATGALDRHARLHQRQAEPHTDAIDDEPFDSRMSETTRIVYGNSSCDGHHRHERPLGERAVADVAALGAAHEAGLPHRERREVVVVEVALLGLEPERVEAHLLARGAEGGHREGLRLAAREQRRAVRARSDAHLDRDRRGSRRRRGRRGASCRPRSAGGSCPSRACRTPAGRPCALLGVRPRRRRRRRPRATSSSTPWSRPGARACPRPAWPRRAPRRTCP